MSDKDLIKREDVAFLLDTFIAEYGKELIAEVGDNEELISVRELASIVTDIAMNILVTVKAIPAVPQEMSAREYIREHRRMCYFYFGKPATDGGLNVCGGCPFRKNGGKGCWIKPGRSESSIAIVEKWVQEHPEDEKGGKR